MLLHWFPLSEFQCSVYNRLAPPAEAYEERQILQEKRIFYGQRVDTSGKVHNAFTLTHTHTHNIQNQLSYVCFRSQSVTIVLKWLKRLQVHRSFSFANSYIIRCCSSCGMSLNLLLILWLLNLSVYRDIQGYRTVENVCRNSLRTITKFCIYINII